MQYQYWHPEYVFLLDGFKPGIFERYNFCDHGCDESFSFIGIFAGGKWSLDRPPQQGGLEI
ncbi:MAG: hypothetical protein CM15mP59_1740 [Flavobacteriaceae bacterium]|nr:MAG: hypothetical protein CM15mP59_1740 [Flavobacteriaceae bacterium]